ncbi:MAG: phage major tail tube protein [Shewanella sp.]|nr:phage major tail tube protein [Shewanella sp.]
MAKLPTVLVDMNVFLKDESYAGLCNTATLPKIVTKTIDQVLAGVAGDIERDVGKLEKLESELTISDYAAKVIDLVGDRASRDEVITLRGALDTDGAIKTVIVRLQGFWKSLELNEWKPESEATTKFAVAVTMFELEIDGKEVIHIDKLNNVFRINGRDRNDAIRQALAQ